MKKKSILFISSNMHIGGFQKSLISLLGEFNYEKYNVDLLLFNPQGVFMSLIPQQVNLIPCPIPSCYFDSFSGCIINLLKKRYFYLALHRIIQAVVSRFDKGYGGVMMAQAIPAIEKEYDTVVDYNGQYIMYYMVDKLKAKKKITYFHSDYKKWPYYFNADKIYFKKVDFIVTVSYLCKESLDELFKDCSHKTKVIENIITDSTVNPYPPGSNGFSDHDFKGIRIVMVGRACLDKGIDFAIEACGILQKAGYNIRWYSVGPCGEQEWCNTMINEQGVRDSFIMLGPTHNPYDYMREADIIAHPSRFEGKAVAVEEAKILAKPIVATNFSTVYDQIEHEETGLIVNMDSVALYKGIKRLIDDVDLRFKLIRNLKNNEGNKAEVERLYELLEGSTVV